MPEHFVDICGHCGEAHEGKPCPLDLRAQAEALLRLQEKARKEQAIGVAGPAWDAWETALRNSGPPLIRALIEQVENEHAALVEQLKIKLHFCDEIAAERDIWRERAKKERDIVASHWGMHNPRYQPGQHPHGLKIPPAPERSEYHTPYWPDPTPEEIAARVAERRSQTPVP